MVRESVGCPRQPTDSLFVQLLDARERATPQEVILHIFHSIFYFTFRFRVGLAAKDALEMRLVHIRVERLREYVVAKILRVDEHGILVVYYLLRFATIVLKRLLVSIDGQVGSEGGLAEPHILLAAATQYHDKEVYLDSSLVLILHPHLPEVHLSIFAKVRLHDSAVLAWG